ncbi:MAG TPA: hypothetical protein VKA91_01340 [Nitrososphaeraceae archaeon]|nr:hypothetical protein [Nitrososphaeraceae archaeon]
MTSESRPEISNNLRRLILAAMLISSVIGVAINYNVKNAYAVDNNWYLGEGAKKGMYVKYNIRELDTNNGRPFDMTIYFKEKDDKGNWVAPVFVVDEGRVISGTFRLSALDLTALGTSEIPPEMTKYRSAYTNSLKWLSAYVPFPGQSLSSASWGKIGSIGGSEIKPSGTAKLTLPAFPKPIDTTIIRYHKSVDSDIWVLNEFPYPVKAKTFVDVTTGSPRVQFEFNLLATGQGEPSKPEGASFAVKPPLTERTPRGTYYIRLNWEPETIHVGNETRFNIEFLDDTQFPLNGVSYDFKISNSNGTAIIDLKNQFADTGTAAVQPLKFNSTGPAKVQVTVNSVESSNIGAFVENADFDIGIVP